MKMNMYSFIQLLIFVNIPFNIYLIIIFFKFINISILIQLKIPDNSLNNYSNYNNICYEQYWKCYTTSKSFWIKIST